MAELRTLMSGLVFGEQPRWHEGRLWFSDWGTHEVIAVDLDGNSEVIVGGCHSRCASTGCQMAVCWWCRRGTGCFCAASTMGRW